MIGQGVNEDQTDCLFDYRFNMPLCQIVGVTSLHSTFPLAWCLISSENSIIYKWLLDQLVSCAEDHEGMRVKRALELQQAGTLSDKIWIHEPYVIITDFDHKLKKAIDDVYGPLCHVRSVYFT